MSINYFLNFYIDTITYDQGGPHKTQYSPIPWLFCVYINSSCFSKYEISLCSLGSPKLTVWMSSWHSVVCAMMPGFIHSVKKTLEGPISGNFCWFSVCILVNNAAVNMRGGNTHLTLVSFSLGKRMTSCHFMQCRRNWKTFFLKKTGISQAEEYKQHTISHMHRT